MHHHDKCGNCGSSRLLTLPATPGQHSHIVLGERVLHTVTVTTYVCTDCGAVEQWVNHKPDLIKLRAVWDSQRPPDPVGGVGDGNIPPEAGSMAAPRPVGFVFPNQAQR
jgi:hypothetical protein